MLRKIAWSIAGLAIPVFTVGKILRMVFFLDGETGLYESDNLWGLLLIGGILAVEFCCFFCAVWIAVRRESSLLPVRRSGCLGMLAGAAVLIDAVSGLFDLTGGTASVMGEQPLLSAVASLAGIFAGLFLIVWSASLWGSGMLLEQYPLTGLILPVWGFLYLAMLFTRYTAEFTLESNCYLILPFILLVLFLYAQSSFFSLAGGGEARRKMVQYGLPGAVFGIASSLPELICRILGLPFENALPVPLSLTMLTLSLYALTVLWHFRRPGSSHSRIPGFAKNICKRLASEIPRSLYSLSGNLSGKT